MCLQYPSTAVRHMAARCVGVMSKIATMETMNIFLEKVLPWLGAIDDNIKQEGAIEALACILFHFEKLLKLYLLYLKVTKIKFIQIYSGSSLAVQWLGRYTFTAEQTMLGLGCGRRTSQKKNSTKNKCAHNLPCSKKEKTIFLHFISKCYFYCIILYLFLHFIMIMHHKMKNYC